MAKRYLIDSNPIIDFFNYALPEKGIDLLLNITPIISIVTQIEILSKKDLLETEVSSLKDFLKIALIHDVNQDIATKTIDIRLNYKIKLPDAIIAATAITHNLILISRNTSDFSKIKELEIINPHSL